MADPVLKDEIFVILAKADYDAAVKADFLSEHQKLKSRNFVGYRWNLARTQILLQVSCTSDLWLKGKTYFVKVLQLIQATEIGKIKTLLADKAWADPARKLP